MAQEGFKFGIGQKVVARLWSGDGTSREAKGTIEYRHDDPGKNETQAKPRYDMKETGTDVVWGEIHEKDIRADIGS